MNHRKIWLSGAIGLASLGGAAGVFAQTAAPAAPSGFVQDYYVALRAGGSSVQQNGIQVVNPRVTSVGGGRNRDSGGLLGLAGGIQLKNKPIRLELELMERKRSEFRVDTLGAGFSGQNSLMVMARTLMLNGYYDFPMKPVDLFLTGGLGASKLSANGTQQFQAPAFTGAFTFGTSFPSNSKTQLAWSLGAGVSRSIGKNSTLELVYRYSDLGKYSTGIDTVNRDERISGKLNANDLTLGLRMAF